MSEKQNRKDSKKSKEKQDKKTPTTSRTSVVAEKPVEKEVSNPVQRLPLSKEEEMWINLQSYCPYDFPDEVKQDVYASLKFSGLLEEDRRAEIFWLHLKEKSSFDFTTQMKDPIMFCVDQTFDTHAGPTLEQIAGLEPKQ